jgi:3-oxoacyl-[acyl-carrier protein] reductase
VSQPTVLIIGASGGIGRAISGTLAQMGFSLALVARDLEKLEQARAEFGEGARDAQLISCDATDRVQVQQMVEQVLER